LWAYLNFGVNRVDLLGDKWRDVKIQSRFELAMGFSFRVDKLVRLGLIRFCAKCTTELAQPLDPPHEFAKSTDF
jgi:hypothetical protein